MKNKKLWIALGALVVVALVFVIVFLNNKPKSQQGTKSLKLIVLDDQGAEKTYEFRTDAEFLYDALKPLVEEKKLSIEAEESTYGLYVTAVNGITADFAKDQAYWAIYVNEEYGQYSIDTQPVADGDVFKLVYERG